MSTIHSFKGIESPVVFLIINTNEVIGELILLLQDVDVDYM